MKHNPTFSRILRALSLALALAVSAGFTSQDASHPNAAGSEEQAGSSESALTAPSRTVWLGSDDKPLPFETPEEVANFLRTADIESVEDIPIGVTKPKKLRLVKGELRSKAAFRYVEIIEEAKRLSDGKFVMYFRDSFINEVAAYELSRLLGMDSVPPTIERMIRRERGSVQMWIENAMMETTRRDEEIDPPNRTRFNRQFFDMRVFDNLINNIDRNSGNILIDSNWKVWWIDHTRSFSRSKELPDPDKVIGCSRELFANLKALDQGKVTEILDPYLSKVEIRALFVRRDLLVQLIEEGIDQRGEDQILFNYGDPDTSVRVKHSED